MSALDGHERGLERGSKERKNKREMEDEPMGGRFLVPLLVPFVRCYWVAACLFYCLKFWSPKVDALTSYGKLAKTTGTAATRSASDRLFALLRAPVVTHKLGWTSFYVFGFLWNLLFHWAFFYRLGWDGEATQPSFRHRWLIGALFGLHLIKRIFECLFVHAFSHRYMTLLNFVAGLSYYFMVPLSFVESYDDLHSESLPSAAFLLVALFLFCFGSVVQLHSHRILASLRHNSTKKTTASTTQDTNYNIPHGGMFRWVSCPHYLGEIILYAALMCLSAPPINYSFLLVMAFVALNLIHSAIRTHAWYLSKFEDYVLLQRSALVPFLL